MTVQRRRTGSAKAADATDARVGRNIRIHRLVRRMSQTALAGEIGVTFQQLQKYEKGRKRVGSGRLARIAEALELPVATLFEAHAAGNGRANEPSALSLIAEKDTMRLVRAFACITDRDLRRSVVSLVERSRGAIRGLMRC